MNHKKTQDSINKKTSNMYCKILNSVLLCASSLLASVANADVRVLIEYNQHAHRVLQIVELDATKSVPQSDHLRSDADRDVEAGGNGSAQADRNKALANLLQSANGLMVNVLWTSSDGRLLAKDIIADPRSTHAPFTAEQPRPSVIGMEKGAYLLDGPKGSAFVEIQLPAHSDLGLGAQSWRFDLTL